LPQGGPSAAGIVGQMLHTLIGYSDAPNGAQLLSYLATVAGIVALMRWESRRRLRGAQVPAPAE
jgi:hypothetical protein